jgi:hypothetical protein
MYTRGSCVYILCQLSQIQINRDEIARNRFAERRVEEEWMIPVIVAPVVGSPFLITPVVVRDPEVAGAVVALLLVPGAPEVSDAVVMPAPVVPGNPEVNDAVVVMSGQKEPRETDVVGEVVSALGGQMLSHQNNTEK